MPNCVFACFFFFSNRLSLVTEFTKKTFINYINIQMHIEFLYTLDKYILIYKPACLNILKVIFFYYFSVILNKLNNMCRKAKKIYC